MDQNLPTLDRMVVASESFDLNSETRISYTSYGNKSQDRIIFLDEGIQGSKRCHLLANALAQQYSVTVLHLPGAEQSSCRHQDNNPRSLASLFADFLQEQAIYRPHVVGLSYGGSVAVELSQKVDLRSLTLISSGEYFNLPTKLLYENSQKTIDFSQWMNGIAFLANFLS